MVSLSISEKNVCKILKYQLIKKSQRRLYCFQEIRKWSWVLSCWIRKN